MADLLANILFTLNVTLPVLVVLCLGIWLKRRGFIDQHFTDIGNKLVFNLALPCLLFVKIADAPITKNFDLTYLTYALAVTIGTVISLQWVCRYFSLNVQKIAVFVQSSYRGNMGIVGLALIFNIYADNSDALAVAAVYLGFMTLVYNIVAVFILQTDSKAFSWARLKSLMMNPLILSIFFATVWSVLNIPLFSVVKQTGNYFASLSLPLALICIGGSLKLASLKENKQWVMWACVVKLVAMPAAAVLGAMAFAFTAEQITLLFIYMSTPTAAASYVMAKQMTNQAQLAAEVIAITTLLSTVSISIGIFSLKTAGYIV
ncbi:auxin efflux carrier [Catenovulum agarivorans DS-2]|uniref:Auxin efflux carrier n=1 Tax=Catenovulum agarivorans DS-2 TaxID=1328313 RepID=W7QR46_9ALTE|nr:AEC family transporter [Catenovulum agarivorans]EWH10343.1 auxin efflux carrier [Catenovulum agarivorans DS-2]